MKLRPKTIIVPVVVLWLAMLSPLLAGEIKFNRDIRPILSDKCFWCHGPDAKNREAELRLDLREEAAKKRDSGHAIVPGSSAKSLLWERITNEKADEMMPPPKSHKTLSAAEKDLLKRWIDEGANYEGHWSFIPPQKGTVPVVQPADWVRNPIDAFVLARLQQEKLSPAPAASPEILLRRLHFDLTGLPPTLAERDAFLSDQRPDAYERLVDKLMASPHFGERMTLAWLDAARYGDSSVHHADGTRDMWGWRDWVINAYNDNLPFDRFTIEQLAGDLLPNASPAQKVASGFNRNHGTSDEGGAIAEEYRVEYIVDRVKTTGNVWLGLSVECGQCHDHKYDPLSQKEYYQLYAFFNNNQDPGMQTRNGNQAPTVGVPNVLKQGQLAEMRSKIAATEKELEAVSAKSEGPLQEWLKNWTKDLGPNTGELKAEVRLAFDEGKGGQTVNVVNKAPAKFTGKPQWIEGKFGKAIQFTPGSHVEVGRFGNLENSAPFSIDFWIKPGKGKIGTLVSQMKLENNQRRGFQLELSDGRLSFSLLHAGPDKALQVMTKGPIPLGDQWLRCVVAYDGSNKAAGVSIYINGEAVASDAICDALTEATQVDAPVQLGGVVAGGGEGSTFQGALDEVQIFKRSLSAAHVRLLSLGTDLANVVLLAPEKRNPQQVADLRNRFLADNVPEHQRLNAQLAGFRKDLAAMEKPITTVMIMEDMAQPRKTYLLARGAYDAPVKNEELKPDVPAALPPLGEKSPRNRLGLAQWLTRPDHPLTARVAVNRHWLQIFGNGIVETAQDFGSQGTWPSHPDLLDWLAVDFVEHGWDVKRLIKQIAMSSTYRQSSSASAALIARDPANRLLARGPRFRLQGELIRDNALAVSGLLVEKIGGPSVKPYQPPGLWEEVSLDKGLRYVPDKGENLYRRSMYSYWKRSVPLPNMLAFDAPTREKCIVQRQRTNTPLQALVTMNDVQFVEAARNLAQRMLLEETNSPEARARRIYRLVVGREPSGRAMQVLLETQKTELAKYRAAPEKATALLTVGESRRDEKLDAAEHAAWTILASMILNLDEVLTKN